ncbi:MAG: hypothetical protein EAZ96_02580 [Oscillatoriales cyanobacterium]|nr:MAG: hypothetical protein EAZ96_02580 [Oscillatoriales cyanobacterium]
MFSLPRDPPQPPFLRGEKEAQSPPSIGGCEGDRDLMDQARKHALGGKKNQIHPERGLNLPET